ncbi:MAG: cyclic-di-AMP receptor [Chloroflexota bacterium]|nr:cyclic-di-AMP receptor [Chloroflexota bacterium]
MKLVIAVVHAEDAGALVDALTDRDHRVTRLQSTGGFLKQANATVMVGVEDAQVDDVLALIRKTCHSRSQFINPMPPLMEPGEFYMPYPVEVTFGGATVFVIDVARAERL